MRFGGILLHGVCYDFFFVTGFMYTDRIASKDIKGQAQNMLVFFTQGIGMYFGYMVAFGKFGAVAPHYTALDTAIRTTRPEETLPFFQSFGRMFSIDKLTVDPALLATTMSAWRSFWMMPAMMAAGIAVLFFIRGFGNRKCPKGR